MSEAFAIIVVFQNSFQYNDHPKENPSGSFNKSGLQLEPFSVFTDSSYAKLVLHVMTNVFRVDSIDPNFWAPSDTDLRVVSACQAYAQICVRQVSRFCQFVEESCHFPHAVTTTFIEAINKQKRPGEPSHPKHITQKSFQLSFAPHDPFLDLLEFMVKHVHNLQQQVMIQLEQLVKDRSEELKRGSASSLLSRIEQNKTTVRAAVSQFCESSAVCVLKNEDLPEPGLPLIQMRPWCSSTCSAWYHASKASLLNNCFHAVPSATA
ncbi:uncharacterized protein BDV17DRAFT_288470 [Aspergillus undulatus]|uniref:uncharacterized protein n=1 Tax=Aspergillus undulatus TaxID=1810928 RepID=UPI003CCCC36B